MLNSDVDEKKNNSLPLEKSWELIKRKNSSNLNKTAISEGVGRISYQKMFENWDNHAKAFSALGITRDNNSRVLTLMPNVATTNYIDYSLDMTGAVCDFVDPTSNTEKIEKYLVEEKITDIIALDLIYAQSISKIAEKCRSEYGIRNIIVCHETYFNQNIPSKIRNFSNVLNLVNRFSPNVLRMSDVIRNSKYSRISFDKASSDELSLITHTSGTTTGIGKAIPISDQNRNSLVLQHELAGLVFKPGQTILHFIPYFAAYGSINTTHLGLSQGMELQQVPVFNPTDFATLLQIYQPNIVLANTPAWLSILHASLPEELNLSFLKRAISGGTPTDPKDEEKINAFLKKHNSKVVLTKGHGLSELCGCGSYTLDGYNSISSMGVPLPLNEYRIRDLHTNELYPADRNNVEGEAYIAGPTLTSGILDGKEIFKTEIIDGKRFLPTKDIVRKNENGELFFIDRIDRMFTRYDAYNVYPLNIENVIKKLDFVEDCVIVPIMSEKKNGNVPHIYLKLTEEALISTTEEYEKLVLKLANDIFVKQLSKNIATFRDLPEVWTFVPQMPKNTMGKNDLYKLKEGFNEGITIELDVVSDNMGIQKIEIQKDAPLKLSLK